MMIIMIDYDIYDSACIKILRKQVQNLSHTTTNIVDNFSHEIDSQRMNELILLSHHIKKYRFYQSIVILSFFWKRWYIEKQLKKGIYKKECKQQQSLYFHSFARRYVYSCWSSEALMIVVVFFVVICSFFSEHHWLILITFIKSWRPY